MNHIDIPITAQHVTMITSSDIVVAESIFINYFTALYKDILPLTLGLHQPTALYLQDIFNKTKQAFYDDQLSLSFAYRENNIVGMCTYELLEDRNILIRTLPINLDYIQKEKEIRTKLIKHIHEKFPSAQNVVIMVRKANNVHQDLCLNNGFEQTQLVFNIPFIQQQYDCNHYYGYIHNFSEQKFQRE